MAVWISRFKQITDLENDDSVTSAIWKWFASMVYGELWSEVSLGAADRYFETSTTITADGSESYDEPEDHFGTVRVARVLDAEGHEQQLDELRPQDEIHVRGQVGDARYWALIDDHLFLFPKPSSGTYEWYYTQQSTDISGFADGDMVDVVVPAGEAFFIWGVAELALGRQGKDVQLARASKEAARAQLQFQAANRNIYEPKTRGPVVDDDGVLRVPGGWEWPY